MQGQRVGDDLARFPQYCRIHAAARPRVALRNDDALIVDEMDKLHKVAIDQLQRTPIQRHLDRITRLHDTPIDLRAQQFEIAIEVDIEWLSN